MDVTRGGYLNGFIESNSPLISGTINPYGVYFDGTNVMIAMDIN